MSWKDEADKIVGPVKTTSQKVADDSLKQNAENASGAGLEVRVSREYDGVGLSNNRQCQWCLDRRGKDMTLEEAYDKGAFQRHDGCGCIIEYTNKKGETKYQTGKGGRNDWLSEEEFQKRKTYGLDENLSMPQERINEAQKMAEYVRRNAINDARAIDAFEYADLNVDHKYTASDLLKELQNSPIGIETIRFIRDGNFNIKISEEMRIEKRGEQQGNRIVLYSGSCKNRRVAGQTLIHEMAHIRFDIGGCQHAEAICFAMEKMHIEGRDYLTKAEWDYVKKLAIDNYPEYNWEKGGYGDYGQFNFVR